MKNMLVNLRRFVYLSLYSFDRVFNFNVNKPFVLCYHSFGNDSWHHGITVKQFSSQLKELTKTFEVLSVEDIEQNLKNNSVNNGFVVTIDDGYLDVAEVSKITSKYNIKPVLFLLSNPKNANRQELENNKPFLRKDQIMKLYKLGWAIGCHSATHSDFNGLDEKGIEYEVISSKIKLEADLGIKINYFAYPKGRYNGQVLKAVKKAGYKMAFSMDDGYITSGIDKLTIPRIGINRSHTLREFKTLYSPSVMAFRNLVKRILNKGIKND